MLTEKSLIVDSITIHYAEGPSNDLPLVMIHGMTGYWKYFVPMMPSLALRSHIFAPDLRGHGASSRTPGAYSLADDERDLIAFLRAKANKPALLVGHSYGAIIATATAASVPQLVRAVVAVDPPLPLLTKQGSWLANAIFPYFRALYSLLSQDHTDADRMVKLAKLLPDADALTLHQRLQQFKRFDPERLLWSIERRVEAGRTVETLVSGITCPLLLIQCNPALGGVLDDTTACRTAELLSNCIHLYRSDAGHDIPQQQPTALAKMVTDFLELL
ncbi:MAG: alpha/beta hydrolase [Caldilineaceae bacterium]